MENARCESLDSHTFCESLVEMLVFKSGFSLFAKNFYACFGFGSLDSHFLRKPRGKLDQIDG